MRTANPLRSENVLIKAASMVSSLRGRAALALVLCLATVPALAVDVAPAAASESLDMSPDMDSATLADLPLETLMRVAVTSSVSQAALAPALSEVYALRYLAPGVDQGGPQEVGSTQRIALITKQAGGF